MKAEEKSTFDGVESFGVYDDLENCRIKNLVRLKKIISSPGLGIPEDFQRALFSRVVENKNLYWEIKSTKYVTREMLKVLDELCPQMKFFYLAGKDEILLARAIQNGVLPKDSNLESEETRSKVCGHLFYTIDDMLLILMEIEKIESRINPAWSDKQKVVFIYDWLRTAIEYDAKYKDKEYAFFRGVRLGNICNRSLRGFYTKETVCVGYSIMFRELLDRQGIECSVSENDIHDYNVVTLQGKNYLFDVTFDADRSKLGSWFYNSSSIGLDPDVFLATKEHDPKWVAPYDGSVPDYQPTSLQKFNAIRKNVSCVRDYTNLVNLSLPLDYKEKDAFVTLVKTDRSQQGYYIYQPLPVTQHEPKLIFTQHSLLIYKYFNAPLRTRLGMKMLYSKEHILDSIKNFGGDLGNFRYTKNSKPFLIRERSILAPQTFVFDRNDGTKVFVIEDKKDCIGGEWIYNYDVFDLDYSHQTPTCIGYKIKLDEPLTNEFKSNPVLQDYVANEFFSKEELDNCVKFYSGYLGSVIPVDSQFEEYAKVQKVNMLDYFDSSEKEISR